MKRVYFVRHGESEGNAGNIRGHASHPLTEKGHQQSQLIAERCSKLPIEYIISSTMVRARETGDTIAEKLGITPEYSDLFIEAQAPSEFRGKPREDPELLLAQQQINENFGVPGWHFSDEENFEDLKERAHKALERIVEVGKDHILVLTHGWFMRMVIAYALFGDELTSHEASKFVRAAHMENTGLSILGYDETKENPWWLWVWNDHAHLSIKQELGKF